MSKEPHRNALKPDYQLLWYRIQRVLGQGAFGITYLAHDINLDRQVAIKEYMPGHLSMRESSLSVQPLSADHLEDFKFGLGRFISEARTLTKFEHPNLIRVFNVFEANNTAYMVMNYEVGESLQEVVKRKKILNETELLRIILPLMSGLQKMHAQGFIHRDIKPGNIFIRKADGSPVLLDFGSARQTVLNNPQTLTNFVSPGYAPIEQYASKSDKQGPWTDIYGFGATLYKIISGSAPLSAIDRGETITHDNKDCYIPLSGLAKDNYTDQFLTAIDHALAFRAQDRPQNITEWKKEFPAPAVMDDSEAMTVENEIPAFGTEETATAAMQIVDITSEKTTRINPEATTVKLEAEDQDQATLSLTPQQNVRPVTGKKKINIAVSVIAGIAVIVVIGLIGRGTEESLDKSETAMTDMKQEPDMEKPAATVDGNIEAPAQDVTDSGVPQTQGDAEAI
ncbi:MAG: serine/threonine protein kinase, partial [Gammaproteobacteria bacterium]|nr:serine/threonine protein kinase [Gammaproteobacteria bacterium]